MKKTYTTLLGFILLFTSTLASHRANHAFQKALQEKDVAYIEQLLQKHKNINVNLQNQNGNTALMFAAGLNYIDMTEKLLKCHHLNINLQNQYGSTALILAMKKGNITLAKKLLKHNHIDVNLQDNNSTTALMFAVRIDYIDMAEQILQDHEAHSNLQTEYASLIFSIRENHTKLVDKLLKHKDIDINLQNHHGYTALTLAVVYNHIDMVERLLQCNQLDSNLQIKSGETALMLAIRKNYIKIAQLLLTHKKINVNLQNQHGNTALTLASLYSNTKIAKTLVKRHDTDINLQNQEGETALMLAIDESDEKDITLIAQLLKHHNIDINLQNQVGETALMLAICRDHTLSFELLLHCEKIDINIQNSLGYTALIFAIEENHIVLAKKLLQRYDIDVNLQSEAESTALNYIEDRHIACNKPQNNELYYVSLVKRTQLPSLDKDHALLHEKYLHRLYKQQPFNQPMKQYTDILLVNKIANELTEEQKTMFYQACLLAYESKNSNYSIQAKNITSPQTLSHYQPVLDQDLKKLLTGYLRNMHMKDINNRSNWAHFVKCYLWANNPFTLQHNSTTMTFKQIHFWSNHNSTYAEWLDAANHTQQRTLFNIAYQQGKYEAVATQHLTQGLKQVGIIQKENHVYQQSITWVTPIIVAGLKALTHQLAA